MSERYWNKGSNIAMCDITKEKCPYPYSYCSICSINSPDGSHGAAQFWSDKREVELKDKREQRLNELSKDSD